MQTIEDHLPPDSSDRDDQSKSGQATDNDHAPKVLCCGCPERNALAKGPRLLPLLMASA
jgi:hypothetical protein